MAAVASARRHVIDRCQTAWTSHSVGAGMIIASAVAFTAPTVNTTSATPAANRHRPRLRREHGEADDPPEPGAREQQHRRPRHVGQDVRRELVDDRRDERGGRVRARAVRATQRTPSPAATQQRARSTAGGRPSRVRRSRRTTRTTGPSATGRRCADAAPSRRTGGGRTSSSCRRGTVPGRGTRRAWSRTASAPAPR